MSVEEKIFKKIMQRSMTLPKQIALSVTGKSDMARKAVQQDLLSNYVPVVLEHIAQHGCSGLKCKRCPLNSMCDKNALNSIKLANQMLAYAKSQGGNKR